MQTISHGSPNITVSAQANGGMLNFCYVFDGKWLCGIRFTLVHGCQTLGDILCFDDDDMVHFAGCITCALDMIEGENREKDMK